MSADGKWKITINSPMGARTVEATIVTAGDRFTGSVVSELGDQAIEGTVDGGNLKWTFKVTSPMPMTLEFDVKVDGDALSGSVKLGMFGNAPLSGHRI